MKDSDLLLVNQAADLLQVSPNAVRACAATGRFREYRHPIDSYRLFRRKDVAALRHAISRHQASVVCQRP